MTLEEVYEKIKLLEFHQKLILKMLKHSKDAFTLLIIEKGLSEVEVGDFFQLCDRLSKDLEEQKAEGFVYFNPLFEEFKGALKANITVEEVIYACIKQNIYPELMNEFKRYLNS